MKKKLVSIFITAIFLMSMLAGCTPKVNEDENKNSSTKDSNKITVVATLFPQYDFAREIVGDKGEVVMLMDQGVESHTYEPNPADIIKINKSDLFIYTGEYMEPWAKTIIDSIDNADLKVLDVSKNINLDKSEDGHDEEEHSHGEEHSHIYDPHIWTSPINAKIMVDNILESLCATDPDNAEYYKENANNYKLELDKLDKEFRTIVENGIRKKIIFGDRFAMHYFAREYGLDYEAAFDSCSEDSEPSVKKVAELTNEIKEENIPVVYYGELSSTKVAKTISDETGAKMLLLHSCHNVSKADFQRGVTYISLMKQNAENLKVGVN